MGNKLNSIKVILFFFYYLCLSMFISLKSYYKLLIKAVPRGYKTKEENLFSVQSYFVVEVLKLQLRWCLVWYGIEVDVLEIIRFLYKLSIVNVLMRNVVKVVTEMSTMSLQEVYFLLVITYLLSESFS